MRLCHKKIEINMIDLLKTMIIYLCFIVMMTSITSCAFQQAEEWLEDEEEKAFIERRVISEEEKEYKEKVKKNIEDAFILFDVDYKEEDKHKK
jgi:hypothetical protein